METTLYKGYSQRGPLRILYSKWKSMKERCLCKTCPGYKRYGGRGIKICERWKRFENFASDMGIPKDGETLERKDVNGDYCPENCEWANWKKQGANRRTNVLVLVNGSRMIASDAAKALGISKSAICWRMRKGYTKEGKEVQMPKLDYKSILLDGKMVSFKKYCRIKGYNYNRLLSRRKRGKPMEEWMGP